MAKQKQPPRKATPEELLSMYEERTILTGRDSVSDYVKISDLVEMVRTYGHDKSLMSLISLQIGYEIGYREAENKYLSEKKSIKAGDTVLLDLNEVSQTLNINKAIVYRLIKEGKLPYKKLGKKFYVDIVDVEKFIKEKE